ncbi:hypothetical protein [Sphingopyxis macrogoltabida]|uniref:DUF4019 domain-containing protein n=1 Tax=Sphingopyxis macrogoltabida TaxID=33050 RepID=A0AAC8YYW6_SPHMC|nr:hypothetical protein [Sphingopyxis macrogoltabida]ALJ13780.1 hypothetical protein LH19_12960 [Sphingopyxis macrogoltabida]AMU88780.1 hypothetical protein ATM17_06950 [Sphingopyxis macrogoltabida]
MAIDRRLLGCIAATLIWTPLALAAPPLLAPGVEREVVAGEGVTFAPTAIDEEGAIDRFAAYTMALAKRDYDAAYAMLRLSFQASNPRLEWEMNLRKRPALWADGQIRLLRVSWYPDPAGQPAGLYAAFDFRGDRKDGTMDCGYVVVHRSAPGSDFIVVRTDASEVPPDLIEDGVPKADVLRQLPCYLGKGIATDF